MNESRLGAAPGPPNHESAGPVIDLSSDGDDQGSEGPDAVPADGQQDITASAVGTAVGGMDGAPPDDTDEDEDDAGSVWSSASMFEDNIEELTDHDNTNQSSADCCSLEEAQALRKLLRQVGPEEFVRRTYEIGNMSAKKLCTAFGASISAGLLQMLPDDKFLELLGALIHRHLAKRSKLNEYNTPDDAARLLNSCKNILVITGAGISTNLGIPDFRSKGTGLYSRLEYLGLEDPQEAFSMELFRESPEIFYSVAKDIYPSTKLFSPTHAFIRLLQDKGKLLTNFTQNIDNLEEAAGINDDKLIQCHGSWRRATCQKCGHNVPGSEIEAALREGQVARCKECARRMADHSAGMKRKRSHSAKPNKKRKSDFEDSSDDEGRFDVEEAGVMKPDITFFGEGLPKTFHQRLLEHDKDLVDLCIVIGTSLKVSPVADIPDFLPAHVPQIYISRDPVRHVQFDIELLGDCDEIAAELCRRAGWDFRHEMIRDGTALTAARDDACSWRWEMSAKAGGIIDAKEIDEGTLGHGKSLSPKAARTRDIQFSDEEKAGRAD